GIAAHVLAVRDGCAPDQCSAFGWLRDPSRIKSNLAERAFDARVKTYSASWPAAGTRGVASTVPSPLPGAAAKGPDHLHLPSPSLDPAGEYHDCRTACCAAAAPRYDRRRRVRAANATATATAGGLASASAAERPSRPPGADAACSGPITRSIF